MGEPVEDLRDALAGRYRIERELGRGGMATVYLAHDLRHDRPVALKVLHPDLAAGLGPERFQREIKVAARLQHPHILTVLDSGAAASGAGRAMLWFTMPYIEGESLRDRLARERQLPVADAVRLTREVALALDFAHRRGAIHRDIKPENILLVDGQALVADFGIARVLGGGDERLTETGMAVGTPAYMSPEQAAGDKGLDARTDIYSLGIVLYEMLAGETPFSAPTAQAMVARRLLETPRPLREVRETVPEGIERAVARALAKAPADRFATAAELARALDEAGTASAATVTRPQPAISAVAPRHHRRAPLTVVLAIGFILGLGVLFGWLRSHGGVEATGPGATRLLAVLPFENLGDSTVEYFADGITDEVRGKLAALPGLQVIASGSAAQYKRSGKSPQQIAQELGVRYLLTGKIRWEKGAGGASRVRVSPELVEIAGGTPTTRWQQPFDASLTDVFQVQADIAGRVAEALDVALGSGEKQVLAERPTRNLPAYDAYLKGEEVSRSLNVGDPATLRRALAYYEQAIAIDSGFVAAWAARSRTFAIIYANSVPDPVLARSALESAERARALAPSRPEPYLALAEYQRSVGGDPSRVLEYAEQGLKLAPRDVNLLVIAALANQAAGRWEEATRLLGRAQAIDPRSVVTGWRLARSLLFLRQHPEALAACERGLELDPTHLGLLETRVMVHLAQGDLRGARQAVERGLTLVDPAALVAYVATYYDLFWVLDETRQALLFQLSPASFDGDRGSWGLALGGAYALRGDDRRAHAYADSARAALEDQVRNNPSDAQLHALLGVAYAYLGRKADAIREGKWGVEALPTSQDGFTGPYIEHQLARIYAILGEADEAIAHLEAVLRVPYYLSKGWLGIDPTFDPIRSHPHFIKLVEGTA